MSWWGPARRRARCTTRDRRLASASASALAAATVATAAGRAGAADTDADRRMGFRNRRLADAFRFGGALVEGDADPGVGAPDRMAAAQELIGLDHQRERRRQPD